jgi:hypothetical protein
MMYMYLQKVISRKIVLKMSFLLGSWRSMTKIARFGSRIQGPDPDLLVRVMDPRIRIHTKMSWVRNTAIKIKKMTTQRYQRFCFLDHIHNYIRKTIVFFDFIFPVTDELTDESPYRGPKYCIMLLTRSKS